MSEERATISFRIDPATRDKIDQVAKSLDRDRSYIIKEAVASYLSAFDQQVAHIQEGIAQADRGEFVPDEEVEAFFDKWTNAES